MKISEAKYRANKKWNSANYERIPFDVPKGIRDLVNAHCAELGVSKNQFLMTLIEREIPAVAREMEARRSEKEN
jgi:hypothetical protein